MQSNHAKADHRLLFCAYVDEPHNAAVRFAVDNREFPKVLVECNQDTSVIVGSSKDLIVTWIF